MVNFPKITIITPTYNQAKFIEQTVRSVISQNYPNLEYIIIDGGSTDGTVEIIKKYERYISYWISEPDKGQAHAINKGLQRCSGDIISWLNSDDLLAENALHEVAAHFPSLEIPVLLSGSGRFFREETGIIWEPQYVDNASPNIQLFTMQMLLQCWKYNLHQPSTFWNRALMDKIGYLKEEMFFAMDLEYWLRVIEAGIPIFTWQRILSEFRLHETSKTMSENNRLKKDLLMLAKKYLFFPAYALYRMQFYVYHSSYQPAKAIIKGERNKNKILSWLKAFCYFPLSMLFEPHLMTVSFLYALLGKRKINKLKFIFK